MIDWLQQHGCQMVAMESTGSYWKPIYNLLEAEAMPAMVVNAQHIKAVPGRKTDVKDAEWIADLLRHGLLKPSFIPDRDSGSWPNWCGTAAAWWRCARRSQSHPEGAGRRQHQARLGAEQCGGGLGSRHA